LLPLSRTSDTSSGVVAAMGLDGFEQRHDQYSLASPPSSYAQERMTTPFTRLVNQGSD